MADCRDVSLPDALPEGASEAQPVLQPGGYFFVKPTTSYPTGQAKAPEDSVKGLPVSGRCWKLECKRKSSMAVAGKLIRKSWNDKMAEKAIQQAIKSKEKGLVDARVEEKRKKRQEGEERKKRKEANQLKSATYQTVSSSTVKKMSRKQLRAVRKMDPDSKTINPNPLLKTKGLNGKVKI